MKTWQAPNKREIGLGLKSKTDNIKMQDEQTLSLVGVGLDKALDSGWFHSRMSYILVKETKQNTMQSNVLPQTKYYKSKI